MSVKSNFSEKQFEEMSATNLTFLITAYNVLTANIYPVVSLIDSNTLNDLCRIGQKDKETKMKLVKIAQWYQYKFNGCPCDYSKLKEYDTIGEDLLISNIVKQSLTQLLEIIPSETFYSLTESNFNDKIISELVKDKQYRCLELYRHYLPSMRICGIEHWKETVKNLDKCLKNIVFSNKDYINFILTLKRHDF